MNQPPNQPPNTPPGYPQQPGGQQPYPQQGQYPQQGPYPAGPMPGMGPVPYYQPPQKKGFPVWAIVLIVIVCMLPVCGIFGLAAIPLITSNTRDARRSEGEQLLGSLKNHVKVAYAKLGEVPPKLTGPMGHGGCGVQPSQLDGKYYRARDLVEGDKRRASLYCDPVSGTGSDGVGKLTFAAEGAFTEPVVWQ